MIAEIPAPAPSPTAVATPRWQRELARAFRDPASLLEALGLEPAAHPLSARHEAFPLRVPRGYVRRMERGNPRDPLLRQVLPLAEEDRPAPGFARDPVGDGPALAAPGLLHKYRGRALLLVTGACGVHCRYCFRRHFPYHAAGGHPAAWDQAISRLAGDGSIHEVILSGGDPLSLPDERLAPLAERLAAIPHLQRLRIHTRLPVVLPERIDDKLLAWLGGSRLQAVMVIHANHGNEIDDDVAAAMALLRSAGITLLNQSVLLRGVNDEAEILVRLSEKLFAAGVLPYYLHLLDRVQGAAHFEVPEAAAAALHRALMARLPGYLVPRLVREEAGGAYKRPVMSGGDA
ncbi:MAG TPA: EF-P beta-lysylation protein EpmB [Gammaproteobacteria bacterium]|nr:EF-P beta-lysylation protein EpmB [Gammaproteobacteria bacterium]